MELSRSSGVLLPLFSLPSPYGIGTVGRAAYDFIDFLAESGQSWWQMLPVEEPGLGNSPYFCMDAFKSSPLLIDLDMLAEEELIDPAEYRKTDWGRSASRIDYDKVIRGRNKLFSGIPQDVLQDAFRRQWRAMKDYAHSRGIGLIGDIPIYVPAESLDVKNSPNEFLLDSVGRPTAVAGCPPDDFSADGQLWGNALYNWPEMKKNGYNWWIRRIGRAAELFDVIRIDHFRGLASYWSIPAGAKTASEGHWEQGPGIHFVKTITEWFKDTAFIAEDLGALTPDVTRLLSESGLPGMRVLEFAFGKGAESPHLPHNHTENCVCYIGTHDNMTARQWAEEAPPEETEFAKKYFNISAKEGMAWGLIRGGMSSPAKLFIVQMQDIIGLGKQARINVPGTASGNWEWRLTGSQIKGAPAEKLLELTKRYGRLGRRR